MVRKTYRAVRKNAGFSIQDIAVSETALSLYLYGKTISDTEKTDTVKKTAVILAVSENENISDKDKRFEE